MINLVESLFLKQLQSSFLGFSTAYRNQNFQDVNVVVLAGKPGGSCFWRWSFTPLLFLHKRKCPLWVHKEVKHNTADEGKRGFISLLHSLRPRQSSPQVLRDRKQNSVRILFWEQTHGFQMNVKELVSD